MSRKIIQVANEIMSPSYGYTVEKMVFLNTNKSACLTMGKTMVDGETMLYIFAQIWNGSRWYTDKMLLCRNANEIITMLKSWLSVHGERRAR